MARVPQRFVGLHNHTGFSPFDGLGYPDEHFKFCLQNGLDAHAITEHGNMNSYAHAQLWVEEWAKSNKDGRFKYIPGVEAYYHPDLEEWQRHVEAAEQAKADKKAAEKLAKEQEKLATKVIAVVDSNDETEDIEMTNALTIENEDETKSTKHFNPIKRRHHLVVLPKNQKGLLSIFAACSQAYLKGFYGFPRIDWKVLREAGKEGNVVVTSACIGGMPAYAVFQELQKIKFEDFNEKLLDDPQLLDRMITSIGNVYDQMTSAVGEGNYYLELQFNRLPAQNLVNRAIIEFARRTGTTKQLVVTCDAHYYDPDRWKDRELYKKLGFMNYAAYNPDSLPKSKDDLKCELYPKNAQQVWDEYLRSKEGTSFYDDDLVCAAIERTHDIAHQVIGEVPPDRSPKFPTKLLVPEGTTPFNHLVTLCKEGMRKRGLDDKPEYVERLKEELGVIKAMKNAVYFISYQKIMELARRVCLVGPARGSGGGSLVAYVLYITDLDPLHWDLPFARFLSVYRKGAPDIDTDLADRDKVLAQLRDFFGWENVVPISNYNTFKLKTLVKDIGKFYGLSFEETNAATRSVEEEVRRATTKEGDDKNLFVLTYDDAMAFICAKRHEPNARPVCDGCTDECAQPVSPSFRGFIERNPVIAESIKILFKQNRSLGRHAGGVLIADDLPNKMPLVTSKGKGDVREPQSPWVEGVNYKHLEKVGEFIKYDLLGLETMRLIERTIELILIKEGNPAPTFDQIKAWYEAHLAPNVIDFDDPKPYEVYARGRWAGIFQCTGTGAQRLFVKAQPKNVIDIATLTSIYRPGPLAAKVDRIYLEAKNEGKFMEWGDQRINSILEKTKSCLTGDARVMTGDGEVTIKELVEGELVGTTLPSYNEETGELEQDAVVAVACNGIKDVIELDTDVGTIKLTADHLVMAQRGWVEAGQLTFDDKILSIRVNRKKIKYISRPDEWFDAGTEARLIDDYRQNDGMFYGRGSNAGLFEGLKDGELDQEVCCFDEFDLIEADVTDVVPVKIRAIKRIPAQPVYDIQVKKNHNFFANGLLVHNCIIFQEQVMELAEKCAGFPKDKCDEVRRAIMKRSISGGEAAKKAAQETRDGFVKGCIANGYTEKVANNLYDKILFFAGYGFNKSHAVAYAIDSYWCAWLLTYHEEQWLSAYLESMSHTPDQRAKAFGEARALGYQIVPIDVGYATAGWRVLPGKKLMPSMTSVKGVGDSAVEEIIEMRTSPRPPRTIEELLYNEDGTWRLSKFNRKALESLIKVRAFDSLGCVGPDKVFKSYRHMHETLMGSYTETVTRRRKGVEETVEVTRDHATLLRRSTRKDPHEGLKNFYALARGLVEPCGDEWTQRELVGFQAELFGTADVTMMFDPALFKRLDEKNVGAIEDLEAGETDIVWFVTVLTAAKKGGEPTGGIKKKTKNGKEYVQAFVTGPVGKPLRLTMWGCKQLPEPFKLCVAEVRRDEYGLSTSGWKVKSIA